MKSMKWRVVIRDGEMPPRFFLPVRRRPEICYGWEWQFFLIAPVGLFVYAVTNIFFYLWRDLVLAVCEVIRYCQLQEWRCKCEKPLPGILGMQSGCYICRTCGLPIRGEKNLHGSE